MQHLSLSLLQSNLLTAHLQQQRTQQGTTDLAARTSSPR